MLSYPRADARSGRERLPSLFFAAAAATLAGRPLAGPELERLVTEDDAAALPLEDALDAGERDRSRLLRDAGAATTIAAGSACFRQSRLASQARWSGRLTRYDGLVGDADGGLRGRLDPLATGRPVSASRLATYARCGFQYLLRYVLHLQLAPEPEERRRIEPLERGGLFHRVAEGFLRERRERGELPLRDAEPMRARLRVLAEEALEGLVAGSPPRFTLLWEREKRRFHETLQSWLGREAAAGERSMPVHFELSFGLGRARDEAEPHDPDPIELELGEGQTLRVCGQIDRIDRRFEGGLVLRDYKTGRAPRDDGGVFRGGRQLQIPFYVLAAAKLVPNEPVVDAFLDYVDGGRQVAFRPELADSEAFRRLLREPRVADRARGVRAGADGLRLLRLHCRVRAQAAAAAPAGDQDPRRRAAGVPAPEGRGMNGFRPVDEDARARTRGDHAASLVLEAGAGTGKTTLLVERIEAMVRAGVARLDEIAAVTFTENAATTMKLRLRERLERARADTRLPPRERERVAGALDVLERASVSTIHALCAQILQERPLECGVLPGFRMADEAQADALFAAAWEEWLGERLAGGDDVLLDALDRGIPLEGEGSWGERGSLRGLARTLVEQRDLEPIAGAGAFRPEAARDELLTRAARARDLAAAAGAGDTLAGRLALLADFGERSRSLFGQDLERHLLALAAIPANFGFRPHWPSADALAEGRAIAKWTKEAHAGWAAALGSDLHGRLVRALGGVASLYERRKAQQGVLDFLDLLLRTRNALRDQPGVRAWFARRFSYVVIDEFQDTDPLQVEIARLLTRERPGALVVVGDAKQSIYRFRRAEVRLFRELTQAAASSRGPAVLHLVQNFRSRPAILRFVNRVFAELIQSSEEADQPAYEAIAPPPGLPEEPSVVALRFPAPPGASGEELLAAEAGALACFVSGIARGGEPVRDPLGGALRPSRSGDVLVLARRLTRVATLEEALEAAGLRFTVEGGKSFFDRQEVHETLAVLRAIDDDSDRISLVAALRSTFFGVSDRDVVAYALAGPSLFGPLDEARPGAEALAPALGLLDELRRLRRHASVPFLLERLYEQTRVLAALTGSRRGEAQIANLEKVAALARDASSLGVLTLRGFARLLEQRITSAREEPDLPATRPGDPDTVRILSIHRAKGLEAPVVALYDTADTGRSGVDTVPLWSEGRIAVGFRGGCQPPGWDALVRQEEKKGRAEARRLLYVACTRARDLLVVPRPPLDAALGDFWKELVERLPAASDGDVRVVDAETIAAPEIAGRGRELWALAAAEGGDAVAARWLEERRTLVERAGERLLPVSATRLAARTAPPAAVAAGVTGGRDFGSFVHKLLEWLPFDDTEEAAARIAAMATSLAPSFGLDPRAAARAAAEVTAVLRSPVLERARRAARVWRELPLWFPDGAQLVEGVVDLVFEEDGQLVVVDYKTDAITSEQALTQAAHHAPQLQLYGRGLAQALGRPVRERLIVFTALARSVVV